MPSIREIADRAYPLLKQHWGYGAFRPGQLEMIGAATRGEDVLGLLPTGGGKSLCYQMAGLLRGGLTIVVSPLVALMKDQVGQLTYQRGLRATYVNSTLSRDEIDHRLEQAARGALQYLYLAPERLQHPMFTARLPRMPVRLLAVDEAHCISQWGFDFRPSYLEIQQLRVLLPGVPCMAVTATATPLVQEDIVEQLALKPPFRYQASYARPNLRYAVLYETDRFGRLLKLLQRVPGSAILYAFTRRQCEELAHRLKENGVAAAAYHAGLPHPERKALQTAWLKGNRRIVVATTAFGMGIDKPDVRMVVHWQMPPDLESYYQEAGRCGRDGQPAYAIAFYSPQQERKLKERFRQRHPGLATLNQHYQGICDYFGIAVEALPVQRYPIDFPRLAKRLQTHPAGLRQSLYILERNGLLKLESPEEPRPLLRFRISSNRFAHLQRNPDDNTRLLGAILRLMGGRIYDTLLPLNLEELSRELDLAVPALQNHLLRLEQEDFITYQPANGAHFLQFLLPRTKPLRGGTINLQELQNLRKRHATRLKALLKYAGNTATCRSVMMQKYFGEQDPKPCGVCDNCRGRHRPGNQQATNPKAASSTLKAELLAHLRARGPQTLNALQQSFAARAQHLEAAIQQLLADGNAHWDARQRLAAKD